MDTYLAPALGSLILLGLTVLIAQMRDLNKTLRAQGERLVELATVVGIDGNGLVSKVEALHSARESEQTRRTLEMEAELRVLRARPS